MSAARTRVKICGITSVEDAQGAIAAGADALGLVFYPPSKRFVDLDTARRICEGLPAFITLTGLFVDPSEAELEQVLTELPIDLIQFHGNESDQFCKQAGKPYIKALRIRKDIDLVAEAGSYPGSRGLLLDTYVKGSPGGTGQTFDWSLVPRSLAPKVILAGGLDSDNVGKAIREVQPYAVDVSGGVESAPGKKSQEKIERFVAAVSAADKARN